MRLLKDRPRASTEQRASAIFFGHVANFLKRFDLMLVACFRAICHELIEGFAACGKAEFHAAFERHQQEIVEERPETESQPIVSGDISVSRIASAAVEK
jgi:hypothetical protein